MHIPLIGSEYNASAKLYKRFSKASHEKLEYFAEVKHNAVVYRCFSKFRWVHTVDPQIGESQLLKGLRVNESFCTIRTTERKTKDVTKIMQISDLVALDEKLWVIDGIQKAGIIGIKRDILTMSLQAVDTIL